MVLEVSKGLAGLHEHERAGVSGLTLVHADEQALGSTGDDVFRAGGVVRNSERAWGRKEFDHRSQGPMLPDEAGGQETQQLLEVLLDQPEERRLPRLPRLVDPAGDLDAQPEAGKTFSMRKASHAYTREVRFG